MSEFFWVELVPLIRDWKDLVFRSANACTLQIGSSKRRASRCLVILINLRGTLFRVLYLLVHYYNNCMEEVSWIRCKLLCAVLSSQPTFQRRINANTRLCMNVEITLIRRWKWKAIQRHIFNVGKLWYNSISMLLNVVSMLLWHYLNVALT